MGVDMSDSVALGRTMDRAMVLGKEEVEQTDEKNERESQDRGLFHAPGIIPRFKEGVKPTFCSKR